MIHFIDTVEFILSVAKYMNQYIVNNDWKYILIYIYIHC